MSSEFGKILKVSVFGQSHGRAIGVNMDGLPAGEEIDLEELQRFLDRRRPGKNKLSTARNEADKPIFLSGLENGVTCGFPLCAIIENSDQHSKDYSELADTPRPSHADYTARVKWGGHADMRGGGHFSGRLTAPLCIAGGVAKQIMARRGIYVGAHLDSVGAAADEHFPLYPTRELFESVAEKPFPALNDGAGARMQDVIQAAKSALDSVGGVIECAAIGLPAGLGDPMFDGVE
ncbi:MAG: chorismate synthase, partial [Lachnospiraceae bacterium]|nr:chorismate synthase [Lachnospiraceae bacterium]